MYFFGDWLLSGGLFGQVVAKGLRSCCSALLVLLSFFRVVLLIGTCCSLGSFVFCFMFFLGWLPAFPRYLRCFLAFSPPPRTCFKDPEAPAGHSATCSGAIDSNTQCFPTCFEAPEVPARILQHALKLLTMNALPVHLLRQV